jgi:uncharacterized membrane protein
VASTPYFTTATPPPDAFIQQGKCVPSFHELRWQGPGIGPSTRDILARSRTNRVVYRSKINKNQALSKGKAEGYYLMQQSLQNHDEKEDHEKDNPALSKVIERNIRTIIHLRTKAARERSLQGRIADAITSFSGRMIFAYVHIVWFGIWILLNTGRFGMRPFDPFPYGLLTMVVSLEAIFLATFVLISQNRLSEETEYRADLDLHIGLLTEHELTRVLQMLDAIQDKLGIVDHENSELADLEMETKPEDVLAEIHRLQAIELSQR